MNNKTVECDVYVDHIPMFCFGSAIDVYFDVRKNEAGSLMNVWNRLPLTT